MPTIAITLGDPAGIGPEIVARALIESTMSMQAHCLVVGDAAAVERAIRICGLRGQVRIVREPEEAMYTPGIIDVLDLAITDESLPFGTVDPVAGIAAVAAIEQATKLALDRRVDAVVTAPINKEAIWAAGSTHLGHTEMFAELTGATEAETMFVVGNLGIFFTTRHMSLRQALDSLSIERVTEAIRRSYKALRVFGPDQPTLAVAAVNPHGGEGGKFGSEEREILAPAIRIVQAEGLTVVGPVPADSVFHLGISGRYTGVLSHYHDQGHIAAKTFDFAGTVSVTTGLPILRTSVDHGTAYDIAGRGVADPATMVAAIGAAIRFCGLVDRIRSVYGTPIGYSHSAYSQSEYGQPEYGQSSLAEPTLLGSDPARPDETESTGSWPEHSRPDSSRTDYSWPDSSWPDYSRNDFR